MVDELDSADLLEKRVLRLSLVFVWLWIAVVSVWELQGQSRTLLVAGGVDDTAVADALVLVGAALGAILGLLVWIPVVWLQLRMAVMAQVAHSSGQELPAEYWRYARWLECLGYPAFVAMLVIFYLTVAKPDL